MGCPLSIPSGTVFDHDGTRIVFVEAVDDIVLRFTIEKTGQEYFHQVDGLSVRLTVRSLLEEFAEGRLVDFGTSTKTLSEWQGRYLGLDRAEVFAREPRAIMKYDIALHALRMGLPRNADRLRRFAKEFLSDPDGDVPSGRSVMRWMDNLQDHDQRIGALKNRSGRKRGASQLPPIADRLVHQSVALFYAAESIKKMDCYALTVRAWSELHKQGVAGLGTQPPSKTAVINRINACEGKETFASKFGRHEAARHFIAAGVSVPVSYPFELTYIDGMEYEQVCLFSDGARIPSSKMKSIWLMDAASKFVFPSTPFAGPYRAEMGMAAIAGALMPPVLDDETLAENPMHVLMFGKLGRLRGDNDKAIIPPSAIGNLASVVSRVELASKYAPDEKACIENFHGFILRRLDGAPGTVLSARSRRKSIRRDPLAEAAMTRESFCGMVEELRLEWNDAGHAALGGRTPNDIMLEHIQARKVRFTPPGEIRRHLARTVPGVLTTDGVVFDNIRYKVNRTGVTKILSENLAAQHFASRLEGTARCDVSLRVFDWNLDFLEVWNDASLEFVTLWSEDPDYTGYLTRYEHKFHQSCVVSGATGAQTNVDRALRRAKGLTRAWEDMHNAPFGVAKKAAAVLELAEVRAKALNIQDDPDLSSFKDLLIHTDVGGRDRAGVPAGPSQSRKFREKSYAKPGSAKDRAVPDWINLEPPPRSNLQMLELDQDDDLDGGIDWDDLESERPDGVGLSGDGE